MTAILIIWNFMGFIFLACGHALKWDRVFDMADGWEFVNPFHIHRYARVNWFGAFVLALIYSAICPVGAAIYWFYKLCTVGRK